MWGRKKDAEWSAADVLAKQVAMNEQTWAALQAHGLTEQAEVRLDFFYKAPTKAAADQLAAFIQDQTDYDVSTSPESVAGSTQPTTVNLDKLNEWVTWMVAAGADVGRCEFDGWGTQVP